MLYTDEFTQEHMRSALDVAAKNPDLETATRAVYEYIKSLNLPASDYDMREQSVTIVDKHDEMFWRGETIGDWIKPAGPFENNKDFYMCKAGEKIAFYEFSEKFLHYTNEVTAPSTNALQ